MDSETRAEIDSAPTPALPEIIQSFKRHTTIVNFHYNFLVFYDRNPRVRLYTTNLPLKNRTGPGITEKLTSVYP